MNIREKSKSWKNLIMLETGISERKARQITLLALQADESYEWLLSLAEKLADHFHD
jgi:hypothetical protein